MNISIISILTLEIVCIAPSFLVVMALVIVEGLPIGTHENATPIIFFFYSLFFIILNIYILLIIIKKKFQNIRHNKKRIEVAVKVKMALLFAPWIYSISFELFDKPFNVAFSIALLHGFFTGVIYKPLMLVAYPLAVLFNALFLFKIIAKRNKSK